MQTKFWTSINVTSSHIHFKDGGITSWFTGKTVCFGLRLCSSCNLVFILLLILDQWFSKFSKKVWFGELCWDCWDCTCLLCSWVWLKVITAKYKVTAFPWNDIGLNNIKPFPGIRSRQRFTFFKPYLKKHICVHILAYFYITNKIMSNCID